MRAVALWMLLACPIAVLADSSRTEDAGEILAIALPIGALGLTWYEKDREGRIQFIKSFGANVLATLALKEVVDKERPDMNCCDSFPSGHTSAAFVSAVFMHRRYGFKRAIPAYVVATYVGYTRVESDRHFGEDVIAGAAIGFLSSWFLTSRFEKTQVTPIVQREFYGLQLTGRF